MKSCTSKMQVNYLDAGLAVKEARERVEYEGSESSVDSTLTPRRASAPKTVAQKGASRERERLTGRDQEA